MSSDKKRSEVVRYWLAKAEESLASGQRELEAGSLSFAMNRLYYAAFYAVSALLLAHQLFFKKHSGVRAAFHKNFIKAGILNPIWGRFYDQLFEDRQEGDYVVFVTFESTYVETQLNQCIQFLVQIRSLLMKEVNAEKSETGKQ